MKKGIIFDFDYTLGDATEGIVLSVNYALEQLGYRAKKIEEIKKTIGLSLKETYMALTGQADSDAAEQFSAFFREKADEVMVAHTALYEGTVDALRKLKENGFWIGIVTTKFHYRIDQILEKFHVTDLVDFIVGAEDVQEEKPNPEGLLLMLKQMHLEKEQALYVGDSFVDAQTAERGGVDFVGVLTGTTTRQDFEKYAPVFIGENIGEIYSYLMGYRSPLLAKGDKVAFVCCSNGQSRRNEEIIKQLETVLQQAGLTVVCSPYLYEKENDFVFSGTGKERAESLMQFYQDDAIRAIFDLSGGDLANEILPYLDYEIIAHSAKMFWGYSDLTTIINAIYAKTGKVSVLYQIKNLVSRDGKEQLENWSRTVLHVEDDLFAFPYRMIQGKSIQGIVVGGNIRCLLKLAGTEYWPDMNGKVLLLEALHGAVPQMVTYLNQLAQIGVFEQINGILLGTFTQMEEENIQPGIIELVKRCAGAEIPIAKTEEIGHGTNSRAIMIGKEISL